MSQNAPCSDITAIWSFFLLERNFGKNVILYDFPTILRAKYGELGHMECLDVQKDVKLSFGALKPYLKDCRDSSISILSDRNLTRPPDWDQRCLELAVCVSLLCNEVCKQVQSHVVEQLEKDIKVLKDVLNSH